MSLRPPQRSESISLEYEIQEARRRADEFSKSLQNSRKEESESIRLVEEERRRWAASYEEKTVMIEQLQRELASTVEALHVQRSYDDSRKNATALSGSSGFEQKADLRSANRQSADSSRDYADRASRPLTVGSADLEARFRSLVNESENLKLQLSAQTKGQEALTLKLEQQSVELEHTKNAWRDSEGKLQFRSNQIRQYEAEREARDRIEADLRGQVRQLEKLRMSQELDAKVQEACKDEASSTLKLQLAASDNKILELERKNEDLSHLVNTLSKERDRLVLLLSDRLGAGGGNYDFPGAPPPEKFIRSDGVASETLIHVDKDEYEWGNGPDITQVYPDENDDSHDEEDKTEDGNDAPSEKAQTQTVSAARRAPVRIPSPAVLQQPVQATDERYPSRQGANGDTDRLAGTATHSILDMQAYSPPRMLLQPGRASTQYDEVETEEVGQARASLRPNGSGSVLGTDTPVGSPPGKMLSRGRAKKVSTCKNATKSPTKKMAFDSDVAADDDSDIIMVDERDNDAIMLNSPDRRASENEDSHVEGDNLLIFHGHVQKQNKYQAKLMRTAGRIVNGRSAPQSQRRHSSGNKTMHPSPTVSRKTVVESSFKSKGHSASSKPPNSKVYDVVGYRATASATSSTVRRHNVGSARSAVGAEGERRNGSDNKKYAPAKGVTRKASSTQPVSTVVGAKRITPGSRITTSTSRLSETTIRSRSAPPKNRSGAPAAISIPDGRQQKVTLIQAKHASNRARAADKDRPTGKRTEVVRIPKSTASKRATKSSNVDLSLSLNSTAGKIVSTK